MMAGIHYVWTRFVAWLLWRTFRTRPEEILELRRVRLDRDRLFVQLQKSRHEIEIGRSEIKAAHNVAANANDLRSEVRRLRGTLEEVVAQRTHGRAILVAAKALRYGERVTLRRIPVAEVVAGDVIE
jgi:hypothetical protein